MSFDPAALFKLSWEAVLKGFQWAQGQGGLEAWTSAEEWTPEKGFASEPMFLLVMQLSASPLSERSRAGQCADGLKITLSPSYGAPPDEPQVIVNVTADEQVEIITRQHGNESREQVPTGGAAQAVANAVDQLVA